jgi:hypothetical protein
MAQHGWREISLQDSLDAAPTSAKLGQEAAATAEVERQGEAMSDIIQPIEQAFGDFCNEEIVIGKMDGRTVAPVS